MKRKYLSIYILIQFALIILVLGTGYLNQSIINRPLIITAPKAGFLAPDLELVTLDGKNVKLSDYQGMPVILNFFTSWCPPCKKEIPALIEIQNTYQDEIVILGVNMTWQDSISDIESLTENYQMDFPILLDRNGSAANTYMVQALPTTFFVYADGTIESVYIGGPMEKVFLESKVHDLIGIKE